MTFGELSYLLPLRMSRPAPDELDVYLAWLGTRVDLVVIDGSDEPVFSAHEARWSSFGLRHVHVDGDVQPLLNGKVAGVITGVRRARYDCVVIADDDVRYDEQGLAAIHEQLQSAEVVRPQNYFDPLPWHAVVDTGRTLLNRMTGGDWPGTIGVRRPVLDAAGGYDGNVMFENLALVRTVVAAGGREAYPLGLYVRRLPPDTNHFWSQRIRQAYDEFARPARLAVWLAVLPTAAVLAATRRWSWLALAGLGIAGLAECGRQRAHGTRVFPALASIAAPVWVCERAVCAWIAVGARLALGGIPYRGRIIEKAA